VKSAEGSSFKTYVPLSDKLLDLCFFISVELFIPKLTHSIADRSPFDCEYASRRHQIEGPRASNARIFWPVADPRKTTYRSFSAKRMHVSGVISRVKP